MAKTNLKHKKIKEMLNNLNSTVVNQKLLFQKRVLNLIEFFVNLDIGWLFVFLSTYLFNFTYPWEWRLIGSVGIYYVYRIFIDSVKEVVKILNKVK